MTVVWLDEFNSDDLGEYEIFGGDAVISGGLLEMGSGFSALMPGEVGAGTLVAHVIGGNVQLALLSHDGDPSTLFDNTTSLQGGLSGGLGNRRLFASVDGASVASDPITPTSYWLRLDWHPGTLTCELWATDPRLGGTPLLSVTTDGDTRFLPLRGALLLDGTSGTIDELEFDQTGTLVTETITRAHFDVTSEVMGFTPGNEQHAIFRGWGIEITDIVVDANGAAEVALAQTAAAPDTVDLRDDDLGFRNFEGTPTYPAVYVVEYPATFDPASDAPPGRNANYTTPLAPDVYQIRDSWWFASIDWTDYEFVALWENSGVDTSPEPHGDWTVSRADLVEAPGSGRVWLLTGMDAANKMVLDDTLHPIGTDDDLREAISLWEASFSLTRVSIDYGETPPPTILAGSLAIGGTAFATVRPLLVALGRPRVTRVSGVRGAFDPGPVPTRLETS